MDQITATTRREYEGGKYCVVVDYATLCGCRWTVDHRGNVRGVKVCHDCMQVAGDNLWEQLALF